VVVVTGGSPIAMPEVYELADALLFAWYPGEQGGKAVADVLYGKANPSGRLPLTFPKSVKDIPPFEDYAMAGRTYRYMEKEPFMPFGFGLSYTDFSYSDLALSKKKVKEGGPVKVTLNVRNMGEVSGDEVIQLYITDLESELPTPLFSLKAVKRVTLQPGEVRSVEFEISADMLASINENGEEVWDKGAFRVFVGGSLPTQKSIDLGSPSYLSTDFRLE